VALRPSDGRDFEARVVVKYVVPADTGSNKPEKYAVQLTARAYWHKRPNGYRVAVLKPKIDRLSVTLAVHDDAAQAEIRDHLTHLGATSGSPVTPWKKVRDWGSPKYDRSWSLKLAASGAVLVQCAQVKSLFSLLRFELNPNGVSLAGVQAFRHSIPMLTAGHFDYKALAANGSVTRVDIAIDLVNIDIEDLLISTAKPGITNNYFGVTGKAETKYLNVNKGGSKLYVYDRRALLEKMQAEGSGKPSEFGAAKYTRVEVRTEVNTPIAAMAGMSNRLLKIDLFDIDAVDPPEELHHWKLFQDSCRYRGLAAALALLPKDKQGAYEAAIKSVAPLWLPKVLWSHWPEALKTSGLDPVGSDP
jgi:hypothetical protein